MNDMMPNRMQAVAINHKSIRGSRKISTPRAIIAVPGSIKRRAEYGLSIKLLHNDAIGHIAMGVGRGLIPDSSDSEFC